MLTTAAFLSVALVLQSTSPAPPPADALAEAYYLFIQGQSSEESNNFDAAADRYRQALDLFPEAAEIRAELAGILAQDGDMSAARREAERALITHPDNRSAHRLLGLIEASTVEGSPSSSVQAVIASATRHLEQATAPGQRDPAVMITLGEMYVRGGQHSRAITILEEFLLDRPGYPQAVMLLVQAYRGAGQPEMAEAVIDRFRGNAAESTAGRIRGIESLESQGQWAQAAEAWSRLLQDQPRDINYRLRYAAALGNSNQLDQARTELQDIARDEPADVRAWYLLAQIEQRAGNTDAAEAAAARIAEIDPADPRGPIAVATIRVHRDDHRGVVSALEARVAAPSTTDIESGLYTEMVTMLSSAWSALDDTRRSIRTLEDARRRLPADQELAYTLAATYEQDDQPARAEIVFRQIIEADPEHAPALNYLGYMLAERGRKLPEALAFIERAIEVAGENPAYLDSLGWAYFKLERYEEALSPLERAASGAPGISVIQEHLGDAYMKLERFADAAAAFDRALAGDRDDIDEKALTRKRDQARAASSRQ